MKEKDISKLFTVFGKGIDRHNMNSKGTGLGLTICKKIVEGMKGEIHVESKYGQGTSFIMSMEIGIRNDNIRNSSIYSNQSGVLPNNQVKNLKQINENMFAFQKNLINKKYSTNFSLNLNFIKQMDGGLNSSMN